MELRGRADPARRGEGGAARRPGPQGPHAASAGLGPVACEHLMRTDSAPRAPSAMEHRACSEHLAFLPLRCPTRGPPRTRVEPPIQA